MPIYNRPYKIFTVVLEMTDGKRSLRLVQVRAHNSEHARELAEKQILRAGAIYRATKLVLKGTAQVAA